VLGRIGTPRTIAALRPLLEHPELRQLAARSLQDCGYRAHDYEAEEIDSAFRREGERLRVIAALVDMGATTTPRSCGKRCVGRLRGHRHPVFNACIPLRP